MVRETTRMTRRGPHAASGLEEGPSHRQELPGRARHPLAREPPQKIQTSEMKIFEAKPGRRAGVGNVGKAASQRPRRPRIAAPVQAQELAAARRRLASFKPVCQRGMSEISPPARRSCSCGRTCRHPNRTLARAEKGARQNLPQKSKKIYSNLIVNFVGQILGNILGVRRAGDCGGKFGAQMRAPRTIPNKTPHMRASRGPAARLTRRRAKSRFGTPRKDRNNSRLHPRSGPHAAICQPTSALSQPQSHSELLHVMSHSRIMVLAC